MKEQNVKLSDDNIILKEKLFQQDEIIKEKLVEIDVYKDVIKFKNVEIDNFNKQSEDKRNILRPSNSIGIIINTQSNRVPNCSEECIFL